MFASLCVVAYTKYPEFAGYYVFHSANLVLALASFLPFRHHFILNAVLFAQRTDCSSCLFFQSHNVDKYKIRAQTHSPRASEWAIYLYRERERKNAMLIIFAFCFVVIHFLDVEKKVEQIFLLFILPKLMFDLKICANTTFHCCFLNIHSWNG